MTEIQDHSASGSDSSDSDNGNDNNVNDLKKITPTSAPSNMIRGHGRTIWLAGKWMIILAIGIVVISYGLFFYFQNSAQNAFKQSLFDQQKDRQLASTKAIAQHIESDLDVISTKLALIAQSYAIGESKANSSGSFEEQMKAQMQQLLDEINSPDRPPLSSIPGPGPGPSAGSGSGSGPRSESSGENLPIVDAMYIVDENGIVVVDTRPEESNLQGTDISMRQYVIDTKESLIPQFSKGFIGMDNKSRIAATFPIIYTSTSGDGKYLGMIVASMQTSEFFQHYGNIYDIKSQYIAILDSGSVQLVHPVRAFVGVPFFGESTQNAIGHNAALNSLIRKVMSGTPDYAIYEFVNGERLTSGYPIYFNGQPTYFVFIITPTSTIYSSINSIIYSQQTLTFSVLAASTAAIAALVFLLVRWNSSLNRAVDDRTLEIGLSNQQLQRVISQLQESNRQLSFANEKLINVNEQLAKSETIQKEFINVAAHELRTPIQPILGLAEIMRNKATDSDMRLMIDAIIRSAERMQHLSSDILDVTRIESQTLRLNRQPLEIIPFLTDAVRDVSLKSNGNGFNHVKRSPVSGDNPADNGRIAFVKPPDSEQIFVLADRERIFQVVSNLLNNALKFTKDGRITVCIEKTFIADKDHSFNGYHDEQSAGGKKGYLLVTVRDSGTGIDPEVFPKLFTKFITKSDRGTGLGLFISKGIIEAHGGRIWAQNNSDGKGATFFFTLPLYKPINGPGQ